MARSTRVADLSREMSRGADSAPAPPAFLGLTLKGPGFFVYLKSGGGADSAPPPLGSRPRSDKKFWNLAPT